MFLLHIEILFYEYIDLKVALIARRIQLFDVFKMARLLVSLIFRPYDPASSVINRFLLVHFIHLSLVWINGFTLEFFDLVPACS